MKFCITDWMDQLTQKVKEAFGPKLWFAGLQGSWQRGEATEQSDIDVVVIMEELHVDDLQTYREIVRTIPFSEKVCGFLSGREELLCWPVADLFQFCYDTKPFYGSLDQILSLVGSEEVRQAVIMGAGNLYHASCHSFLFEDAKANLPSLYKAAFFLLQAKSYLEQGKYAGNKEQLSLLLAGTEAEILSQYRENLPQIFDDSMCRQAYEQLIQWSGGILKQFGGRNIENKMIFR